jgi:hypothetical protein
MGWSIGFDETWQRDIGYGVPAICDAPGCDAEIDRGLSFVCAEEQPYGGENGCGLYFCGAHRGADSRCARCEAGEPSYDPKPEHPRWAQHKLSDPSWARWREENPADVSALRDLLAAQT